MTLLTLTLVLALSLPAAGPRVQEPRTPASRETIDAARVLAAQALPLDDPSRTAWRRTPGPRAGRRLTTLTVAEREAVQTLLRTNLSQRGYERVMATMRHDDTLARQRPSEAGLGSGEYAVAIYGQPSETAAWSWRLEGHHVSVRMAYGAATPSATPLALGMESGEGAETAPGVLADREARVLALARSLAPPQREQAGAAAQAPGDVLLTERTSEFPRAGGGLPFSMLSSDQQTLAWAVIDDFVGDLAAPVAHHARARLERLGPDALTLAFRGETEPGRPQYLRIAAADDLFEYQNVGRHIHSTWRSARDFGR